MDLKTRKLNAIEYLIGLEDEKVLAKIETTITETKRKKDSEPTPFTELQLINRAKKSNSEYLDGRFKTQEELEKESKNW